MRGKLIVVEGIDGAGKTTLLRSLAQTLIDEGKELIQTFRPTHDEIGRIAREMFTPDTIDTDPNLRWMEREMLLAADAMRHMRKRIIPALQTGRHVLCDRYIGSARAYAHGVAPKSWSTGQVDRFLESMYELAPVPNLVILIDVPVEVAIARTVHRRDRSAYDQDVDLLKRVRAKYLELAKALGWVVLDGQQEAEEIQAEGLMATVILMDDSDPIKGTPF